MEMKRVRASGLRTLVPGLGEPGISPFQGQRCSVLSPSSRRPSLFRAALAPGGVCHSPPFADLAGRAPHAGASYLHRICSK